MPGQQLRFIWRTEEPCEVFSRRVPSKVIVPKESSRTDRGLVRDSDGGPAGRQSTSCRSAALGLLCHKSTPTNRHQSVAQPVQASLGALGEAGSTSGPGGWAQGDRGSVTAKRRAHKAVMGAQGPPGHGK